MVCAACNDSVITLYYDQRVVSACEKAVCTGKTIVKQAQSLSKDSYDYGRGEICLRNVVVVAVDYTDHKNFSRTPTCFSHADVGC